MKGPIASRIVGYGTADPEQLLASPWNWRIHPQNQQAALEASLGEIGYVQTVIVNQRTGHLVDGHLRVTLAMRAGETSIPVSYVDLSEDEEKLALAALDSITGMAKPNAYLYQQLLEHAQAETPALEAFVQSFAASIGDAPGGKPPREHHGAREVQDPGALAHTCPDCGFTFD